MTQKLRPDLPPLPTNMRHLPIKDGYPVPWFVPLVNGVPDPRIADGEKMAQAIKRRLCWVCGKPLNVQLAFVIGPMCAVTRTTAEPPCHPTCAIFSATACPFLKRPKAERRDENLPEGVVNAAGYQIMRNPGCCVVWFTRTYKLFPDADGKVLITVGPPDRTLWFAEGRLATRAEVLEAMHSGLPILKEMADAEGFNARMELGRQYNDALELIPAE